MADSDDHGEVVTPRPGPGGLLHRARAQAHLDYATLLESHQDVLDSLTGLHRLSHALEQLVAIPHRRVLWSGTATLDANGIWTVNREGARAIFVVNVSGNGQLVVHAGTRGGSAPGPGPGVHIVPAGTAFGFNNDSNDWTLYGTPTNQIDVQLFGVTIQPSGAGNI